MAILAAHVQVDLLFTDIVMPGAMDGVELARTATLLRAGLKVLLASGFPGVRGAAHRVAEIPFPLLNKPNRHDELAAAIRTLLDRREENRPAPAGFGEDLHDSEQASMTEQV